MHWTQIVGLFLGAIVAAFLREWLYPGSLIEGRSVTPKAGDGERSSDSASEHASGPAVAKNLLAYRPSGGVATDSKLLD